MVRERVIPKNVTLYETDLAILRQARKDNGLASLSAALRWIIHDWTRMKLRETSITAETPIRITEQPR